MKYQQKVWASGEKMEGMSDLKTMGEEEMVGWYLGGQQKTGTEKN